MRENTTRRTQAQPAGVGVQTSRSATYRPRAQVSVRSLLRSASVAGEMPTVALLAAVGGQTLAELSSVPECGGAGFGLGREPTFACARLAATPQASLPVGEPAFDVPLAHYRAYALRAASPKGLPSESRQTAQRAPGWITSPPSSFTCCSAASRSSTSKYGREY